MTTFYWVGAFGMVYPFEEYLVDGSWPEAAGLYIFVKVTGERKREALYLGETGNLHQRGIPTHEKLPCVQLYGGGTFAHVLLSPIPMQRRAEETDLIREQHPPCNA